MTSTYRNIPFCLLINEQWGLHGELFLWPCATQVLFLRTGRRSLQISDGHPYPPVKIRREPRQGKAAGSLNLSTYGIFL